jgi:hypothetical protein
MYFSLSPNIQYDSKPVKFPFSQSDYVVANNFFRRYQINPDKFSYSVFFKRYAIKEGDRWDTIADMAYSTPLYDWILILTNNVINPQFDMPVSEYELRELVENPEDIAYYETISYKNSLGKDVIEPGIKVDEVFYRSPIYVTDTTTPGLPTVNNPIQATATVFFDKSYIKSVALTDGGAGYESTPSIAVVGDGSGAQVQASLSSNGPIKRIDITNSGDGYTYAPDVTLGGGLAGQSATAEITNGQVTNIILDGVKFDTTDANQIYEFGGGTSIADNGSGTGSTGGFDIGGTHLRFGDSSGTRYVTLNPINATGISTVRVYAIRGNGSNGGETPDVVGTEDLQIQYQITNTGEAPDPTLWQNLGIVIDAVPNGQGTGVLDNYDFDLTGTSVQAEHVYFRLYQAGNSGPQYDHYGILSVNFISDANVSIPPSTITITTNPLQTTPPTTEATAEIILSRSVSSLSIINQGTGYSSASLLFSGGNADTQASGNIVLDNLLRVVVNDIGYGYNTSTVTLSGGGGTGASAVANITDKQITSITINDHGENYVDPPVIDITAPDYSGNINVNDIYSNSNGTWKWNGSNWLRMTTSPYKYNDNGITEYISGDKISQPVTNFMEASRKNEKSREIYILRPEYLQEFVNEFKKQSFYAKSTNYVGKQLKKSGI